MLRRGSTPKSEKVSHQSTQNPVELGFDSENIFKDLEDEQAILAMNDMNREEEIEKRNQLINVVKFKYDKQRKAFLEKQKEQPIQ